MATSKADDQESRRAARASWPIVRFSLADEPPDDLSAVTTAAQRISMMTELAEQAWTVAGRALPRYERSNAPGRLFHRGERRSEQDDD